MFEAMNQTLNWRKEAQSKKVINIEVKEAVQTPGGMIVYIPIKKTKSLKALGLVSEVQNGR